MVDSDSKKTTTGGDTPSEDVRGTVVDSARSMAQSQGFQARIYGAIAVQRPAVLEYLRSMRRDKPDSTVSELLKDLDSRYIATVTATSTGVGASAAIPGVGIPIALGLGVADLLFFYETSALYVLAVAELHGIEVTDAERARPLVLGTLLGQKSGSQMSKIVLAAAGAGSAELARSAASGAVAKFPGGWGEVLTEQLPDSALAPLTVVIAREALKTGGKLGAGTLGKAVPFGIGAVVGGMGSFFFGRDVTKATRIAFPEPPNSFPEWLLDFAKPDSGAVEPSRASLALHSAAGNVKNFGEDVWDKVGSATDVFRSIDLDGDGVPDEARVLSAAKGIGSVVNSVAGTAGNRAAALFKSRKKDIVESEDDAG